jgi:hypothetical protein
MRKVNYNTGSWILARRNSRIEASAQQGIPMTTNYVVDWKSKRPNGAIKKLDIWPLVLRNLYNALLDDFLF